MPECKYGTCRAANLCKHDYCVGAELERDGYTLGEGGKIVHAASHVPPGRRECPYPEIEATIAALAPGEYKVRVFAADAPVIKDEGALLIANTDKQLTFQRMDTLRTMTPSEPLLIEREKDHGRR